MQGCAAPSAHPFIKLVNGNNLKTSPYVQDQESATDGRRIGSSETQVNAASPTIPPEADHQFSGVRDRAVLLKETEAFLGEHLPVTTAAAH